MSYSFSVRAATKAEAILRVGDEMRKVIELQPIHKNDQAQALSAAEAFVDLLKADESKDVSVSMNGSIWHETGVGIKQASVTVSASLVDKGKA